MNGKGESLELPELLSHAGWLRRLATRLVGDPDAAEDVVQSTLVTAWSRPPRREGELRPWLAEVARNQAHDLRRGEQRRRTRQDLAASEGGPSRPESPVSPEQLIGDLQIHRTVAELVTALPEPYRQTLVLHFYDGLPSADIARQLEIPAGTVRWRLKEGLERLRTALDRHHDGDRQRWQRALLPLLPAGALEIAGGATGVTAAAATGRAGAAAGLPAGLRGSALAFRPGLIFYGAAGLALLLVAGAGFTLLRGPDPVRPAGRAVGSAREAAAPGAAGGARPTRSLASGGAVPRFAPPASPGGDLELQATRRESERALGGLLAAIADNDYDRFVDQQHNYLKARAGKALVKTLWEDLGPHLRAGYEARPLASLRKQIRKEDFLVYLWKLEFRDRSPDVLVHLWVKDGLVAAFQHQ